MASLAGAALTAVSAQIAFHLPGNPIPITLQVFAVACCANVLGSRLAALSQLEYLAAGLLGAPIFAGFKAGPAALAGPTGGYLIGFAAMAFVTGLIVERSARAFPDRLIAGLIGVAVLYTCGAGWLAVWLRMSGSAVPTLQSWLLGAAPFVGVDAVKVAVAARLGRG